ncbi:hypothetical protein [Aquimarina mytili]|uniref:Uncharacterized protein n=1 Tax=Aquimarina mytili TaxID=874423 RepID=A0A937A0L7_9FLAO|nr:hypothetical protein [Aquimarina mytili]MBL0682835.1 hypothetical protein [Aquimarina mytili]
MDSTLIDQLHNAINAKTMACDINEVIDIKPLINTCDKKDRLSLEHADFAPDPDDQDLYTDIKQASEVAYWKVKHPTEAKIIGLCWYTDGTIKLFKAIVLPP